LAAGCKKLNNLKVPNQQTFPFEKFSFKIKGFDKEIELTQKEINTALQYSQTVIIIFNNKSGIPDLLNWIKKHQINEHQPSIIFD
jgi:hypothetical protein